METFANLDTAGAIYPMVGAEGVLFIIGLALWIIWHIWQLAIEKNEHQKDVELAKKWKDVRAKDVTRGN